MRRASRASHGRAERWAQWRLVLALLAMVAGVPVAVVLAESAAGAATPRTVTVTFTDSGPNPAAVQVTAGDSVKYVNGLTQGGSVPVAGGATGQVQSASVTVHKAAASDFTLATKDSSRTLTYASPGVIAYTATYTLKLAPALGLPGTTSKTTSGRVTVVAAPAPAPRQASTGSGQAPAQGGAAPAQQPSGSGGAPAQGMPQAGSAGGPAGGGLSYQAPGQSVADRVMPHGAGGSAGNTRPEQPSTDAQGRSNQGLPQLPDSTGRGSPIGAANRNAALGLPAVIAVVLLCAVTAALVHQLIARRGRAIA